jgi:hypothetical protein
MVKYRNCLPTPGANRPNQKNLLSRLKAHFLSWPDSTSDEINTWREKYGTFKLSDTYSVQVVKDLLEKSKENVRKNKEKIIRTIKEVVG